MLVLAAGVRLCAGACVTTRVAGLGVGAAIGAGAGDGAAGMT